MLVSDEIGFTEQEVGYLAGCLMMCDRLKQQSQSRFRLLFDCD